jgi:hypothetical protein
MDHKYEPYLERIAGMIKEYPGYEFRPPCLKEGIEDLRERARSVLSLELPAEYLSFLRITDGLEWDGLLIYASKSAVRRLGQNGSARRRLHMCGSDPKVMRSELAGWISRKIKKPQTEWEAPRRGRL